MIMGLVKTHRNVCIGIQQSPLDERKPVANFHNDLFMSSYFHNFETLSWSAVYKHKLNEDFKLKLGYDSDVRLYWSSIWVRFLNLTIAVPWADFRKQNMPNKEYCEGGRGVCYKWFFCTKVPRPQNDSLRIFFYFKKVKQFRKKSKKFHRSVFLQPTNF